jgi:hypothetical protein
VVESLETHDLSPWNSGVGGESTSGPMVGLPSGALHISVQAPLEPGVTVFSGTISRER